MQNRKRINLLFLLFFSSPLFAQNIGQQYSLGFYKSTGDSLNFHSSVRDYMTRPQFVLPEDTTRKRSWFHRKIFSEHLLEYNQPDYTFYLSFLPDFQVGRSSVNKTIWLNTRGAVAGGKLGKNFEFRAEFFENQARMPKYLDHQARLTYIMPGQAEIKDYNSGNALDYSYSTALLSYSLGKFMNFQLGYDQNFIGDGYRSMLLSDDQPPYPFLKTTATVGKIKYTVMWAQLMDLGAPKLSYNNGHRKKWGVFHYLDWNVSKKFSVGIFESVIWQDADSTGKRGFDASYLIPIAFLRPVEFSVGSPDNALMGLNLKYSLSRNSTLYGQFLLDEFKLKEIWNRDGWWGNKFGGQLGFRSNDLLHLPRLNFLTEINAARPFTYSQRTSVLAYSHTAQSLAHPFGGNFMEWMNIADYQYKRWFFRGQVQLAKYGLDTLNSNFGKDVLKSYETRTLEYNNKIGQGVKTNFLYLQGTIAFLLNPKNNLRLEVSVGGRQEKNSLFDNKEFFCQIGLRSTFRQLYYDL